MDAEARSLTNRHGIVSWSVASMNITQKPIMLIGFFAFALLLAIGVAEVNSMIYERYFWSEAARSIDALLSDGSEIRDARDVTARICPLTKEELDEAARETNSIIESMDSVHDYWFTSRTSLISPRSWLANKSYVHIELKYGACWAGLVPPGTTLSPPTRTAAAASCRAGEMR